MPQASTWNRLYSKQQAPAMTDEELVASLMQGDQPLTTDNPLANSTKMVVQGPPPAVNSNFDPAALSAASKEPAPMGPVAPPQPPGMMGQQDKRAAREQRAITGEEELKKTLRQLDTTTEQSLAQQRSGIGESEAALRKLLEQNPDAFNRAIRPLATLTDSWTGSHLAQGIDHTSEQNRAAQIMNLQNMIQNQRHGLTKDQEAALKTKLGIQLGLVKTDTDKPVSNVLYDRMDQTAHQKNLQNLKKDTRISQQLTQYNNLDNAMNNVVNAQHLTPQQIDEFQQAVRSNLGIKGSGGVDERAHTYINTLGLNGARIEQFLTGKPEDISRDSALVQHLQDLVRLEQGNVKAQLGKRIQAVTAGNESMYARRPDLKSDIMQAIGASQNQFGAPAPVDEEAAAKQKLIQMLNDPSTPPEKKAKIQAALAGG